MLACDELPRHQMGGGQQGYLNTSVLFQISPVFSNIILEICFFFCLGTKANEGIWAFVNFVPVLMAVPF